MTPEEARDYLRTAVNTATGRTALADLGFGALLDCIDQGDDASTLRVARELATYLLTHYATH